MTNTVENQRGPAAPLRPELSAAPSLVHRISRVQATPIVVATVLLFVVAAIAVPNSLTGASLLAMIVPAAVMAVAGIGQTLVVQQKGIDLSTAGSITLAAIILTAMSAKSGAPLWLTFVVVAIAAALGGLVNGILVTKLSITPIVATLASNSLFFGAVWTVSGGSTNSTPKDLVAFASGSIGPVPNVVAVAIVVVVVAAVFMSKSSIGKRFVGVGANPEAARAAGVAVDRYIISSYVASSLFGALAGVLLVGYLGIASLTLGTSYQLPVIAAVVVGGAILTGGRGSIVATAIACVFLSQIVQMVLSLGAPNSIQLLVQSIALAVAAAFRLIPWDKLRRKNSPVADAPIPVTE